MAATSARKAAVSFFCQMCEFGSVLFGRLPLFLMGVRETKRSTILGVDQKDTPIGEGLGGWGLQTSDSINWARRGLQNPVFFDSFWCSSELCEDYETSEITHQKQ